MPAGAFTFVLHSHLPWVRRAGRWPFGEEWLHQALLDVYLPLLDVLEALASSGLRGGITLGVTPVLLEQLGDPYLLAAFDAYLDGRIALTEGDLAPRGDACDAQRGALARRYVAALHARRERWRSHWQRDVVGALREFARRGTIEVITSAATHALLPLLATDAAVDAELAVGIETTQRRLGVEPRGIWLPECAYRGAYAPAGVAGYRPGLDAWLGARGIRYGFVDAHAVTEAFGARRAASGSSPSPGWSGTLAESAPALHAALDAAEAESIADAGVDDTLVPHVLPSGVAFFARDPRVSRQVWSHDLGYPGDGAYREFHKRDERSGNAYWRVTSRAADLAVKEPYDPAAAGARARVHAADFAALVTAVLQDYQRRNASFGIVVAPFDAELFGHWWFEGPQWLVEVLRLLHGGGRVALSTPSAYLAAHGARPIAALRESSWGEGGDSRVWHNGEVAWMWPVIHRCEREMERIAARETYAPRERTLAQQAGRELLLLAASDWPFLITTGQARDYATARFNLHAARFGALAAALQGAGETEEVERALRDDALFPQLDVTLFRARAPRPLPAAQLPLTHPLVARLVPG